MKNNINNALNALFKIWADEEAKSISPISAHGSSREYYRITGKTKKAIGVYNSDKAENLAFLSFSKHFYQAGLNVPQIYAESREEDIYLIQDLGDVTLFDLRIKSVNLSQDVKKYYEQVVDALPLFQIHAKEGLDFSVCYPRGSFDRQSMQWDLNYFKYHFLKPTGILFHEQELEDDFQSLINFLLTAEQDYFLYRDYQSRNIMIHDNQPWFIDYQGGRKGALHYDLASLLFDGKADLSAERREELLERYINRVSEITSLDRELFIRHYYGYVLIRILQALGAYGYRGFYERKVHFLQSVPYAQKNIDWLINNKKLPLKLSALIKVLSAIATKTFIEVLPSNSDRMTIRVMSFSYKKGLPQDNSGHGGGFIFDCRFLPNPGRYDEYKQLTGCDEPVIEFLQKERAVLQFQEQTQAMASGAVENYLQRKFSNLMICFGCTGGRHRSVYLANQMAAFLREKYDVDIVIQHREQDSL